MQQQPNDSDPAEASGPVVGTTDPTWWNLKIAYPALSVLAVGVVVALVAGLSPVMHSGSEKSTEAVETTTGAAPVLPDLGVDSDGDGIPDAIEIVGWTGIDGTVFVTDPENPDTDSDGLSDGEEAGELISSTDEDFVYAGVSNPTMADSDDDGLGDRAEALGWRTEAGELFFTDPMNPDTEGDGLLDGEEAGALVSGRTEEELYVGYSNPELVDTDGDGLSDVEEADAGTDPYLADTDNDALSDFDEVMTYGTDPMNPDSDGDGFDDKYEVENREDESLDPLFWDERTSVWSQATEFAKGAVFGEARPSDSTEWLAGNLVMGGAGFIPVVGVFVSGLADIRDAIAQAIRGEWVGLGFTAVGLVPVVGDAAAIPKKVTAFVKRFPDKKPAVGRILVRLQGIPDSIKIKAAKATWSEWDNLLRAGADDRGLLRIQSSGRMDLDQLGKAIGGKGHVMGPAAKFQKSGREGEETMTKMLSANGQKVDSQVSASTAECVEVCNDKRRIFDQVVNGVAHEAKVGHVQMSDFVRRQIMSDAYLIKTGAIKDATWHFYPSAATSQIGAAPSVIDLLKAHGIDYTIHLPVRS